MSIPVRTVPDRGGHAYSMRFPGRTSWQNRARSPGKTVSIQAALHNALAPGSNESLDQRNKLKASLTFELLFSEVALEGTGYRVTTINEIIINKSSPGFCS